MEILTSLQRRGLRYIEAANLGGYQPLPGQVCEWVGDGAHRMKWPQQPNAQNDPESHKRDGASGHWVTSTLFIGVSSFGEDVFSALPESYIEDLIRFSWVTVAESEGLQLSPFGRALLRSDALVNDSTGDASVVILEADSPLAYPQLVGHIASCGSALVVDPYATADHVWQLLAHTGTSRVLTGPKLSNKQVTELRLLLAVAPRGIEVRQAQPGDLHDRYIIGDQSVFQVGASWNGVGKSVTTVFPFPRIAAEQIAASAERWWADATPVEPAKPRPSIQPGTADPTT